MSKKSIDKPITEIANDTGLNVPEISMALSASRLLGRDKLKKIYDANYPIEYFLFGRDFKNNPTEAAAPVGSSASNEAKSIVAEPSVKHQDGTCIDSV
ncbi:hypothetical protein WCX49_11865 [Sulfurimonas sp. HSL-1656]|uniref:hypothetical protein n=1 Tax=Thiomicrolovo subterrani TaxID=3131934 RepID=UPI0031F8041A